MPLSNKIAEGLQEVDVIVCGGGTAGCTIAGRLAEADPGLSVLLIEGGENHEGKDSVKHPILMALNLMPDSKTTVAYPGKKADAVNGRAITVHTGGVLGGGSSVNFMLYSRAQGIDFDSWDMPGWSASDMVPLMRKLETFRGSTSNPEVHGESGPVQITEGKFRGVRSQEDFLDAASRLGHDIQDDLQDPTSINIGFERAKKTISAEGQRHDAATAYIQPLLRDGKHPNLHVLCEARIIRVLFDDDKRACGVEYVANPDLLPAIPGSASNKLTIGAKKLVVLSAGAFGTPLILERSGVGNAAVLEKAGIPKVVDVPGVGMDYDDHSSMYYPFTTNLRPDETGDALFGQRMSREDAAARGMLSWNLVDVHGKLRPTEDEVAALGPQFQQAWERDFKGEPSRPLMMSATVACFFGDPTAAPPEACINLASFTAYSYSRGHIHATGPALQDPVDFDPGFLSDPQGLDLKMHVWQYKKLRQIMRSIKMYTGELSIGHPDFPPGSTAGVQTGTLSANVEADPQYTADDDAAIEAHIRNNVSTTWHSAGTAKMAPRKEMGVVDEKLNVYGVAGLKCIDLSIMPKMVGANTNLTAFVIGEKGAEIILRELGITQ